MAEARLYKPLKIGNVEAKHRIGMAPLTRCRATVDRVPVSLMKEYYRQRASVPGTMIIMEGTLISPSACGGFPNAPGIWGKAQVAGWKTITDEVHRKGCFIFCQLFAFGRAAEVEVAKKEGLSIVGPSAIPINEGSPVPRPMTVEEIIQTVQDFVTASKNAINAGFDDVSNKRDDEYGGSVENRARLLNDVLKAVIDTVSSERVGLRLSPWSEFQGMRMKNPIPQFSDIIEKATQLKLAYLHLVESRVSGGEDYEGSERLDFAYKLWNGPLLVAGGYKMADAQKLVDEEYPDKDIVIMFGRLFISNPDLVYRTKEGLKLNAYERKTFYVSSPAVGYVDYPFGAEYLASKNVQIGFVQDDTHVRQSLVV